MRKQHLPIKRLATEEAMQQVADDLKYPNLDALYVAVGEGHVSPQSVVARLSRLVSGTHRRGRDRRVPLARPVRSATQRHLAGRRRSRACPTSGCKLGRCCTPVPGDEIIGFVTRGQGVSVHRTDCPNVKSLRREPERLIEVTWSEGKPTSFTVAIQVEALDRTRLLSDVATVLSDSHVNILSATSTTGKDRITRLRFTFELGRHRAPVQRARGRQARGGGLRRVPRGPQLTMRIVLQRVARASVTVDGDRVAAIGPGYSCWWGSAPTTPRRRPSRLAEKVANLRIFARRRRARRTSRWPTSTARRSWSRSSPCTRIRGRGGGRRGPTPPSPAVAAERVEAFASALEARGIRVGRGVFGAHMEVELVNDGPFTLVLDTGT